MKRRLLLVPLVIVILSLLILVGCNDNSINDNIDNTDSNDLHTHAFGEWTVTKEPTCTKDGIRTHFCNCGYTETESVASTGHDKIVAEGRPSNCLRGEITDQIYCSICKVVFQEHTEISPALGHSFITESGVPVSCTSGIQEKRFIVKDVVLHKPHPINCRGLVIII